MIETGSNARGTYLHFQDDIPVSSATPDTVPREAHDAHLVLRSVLGDAVVGVYLFGSAVIGGLRPDSDVDVLAVAHRPMSKDARQRLARGLMEVSGEPGEGASARPVELTVVRLSDVVPWRFPPQSEFVYGEWLRQSVDLRAGARPGPDPDLAIVLATVRQGSIAMLGPRVEELLETVPPADVRQAIAESLPTLVQCAEGDERNVLLTLARMWMTSDTGEIMPKDVAAAWALTRLPAEHADLLRLARAAYLGESSDEWGSRQQEMNAVVTYMKRSVEASLDARAP